MPLEPMTKEAQLAEIASNEKIIATLNSNIDKGKAQIEAANSQIQSKDETILFWQNKLKDDPTNEEYKKSINSSIADKTSLQNFIKTVTGRLTLDQNRLSQVEQTISELKTVTIITESYSQTSVTTITSSTTYTQTTNTTETTTTTSSEQSSVNAGAANRTDADQTDPSKVPEAIPGDGATPTAGEKAASDAKASSKPSGSAKDAQDKAAPQAPAKAQWRDATDMRVTLRVPESYLVGPCAVLKDIGGILFPYTPEVSYESKATYGSQQPLHSNFAQYFYQRSSVGPITVTGKFSNQNQKDGVIYLGILHLLRALIKMPWGSDANAGSPPPICRFDAFGDSMLNNVPVVVDNFKAEMPSTVDYISVSSPLLGNTMVPTITQISMSLNIVYSRQEMQNYSVEKWLNSGLKGSGLGGRGYL